MNCEAILSSGNRKGEKCGRMTIRSNYCGYHKPKSVRPSSQSRTNDQLNSQSRTNDRLNSQSRTNDRLNSQSRTNDRLNSQSRTNDRLSNQSRRENRINSNSRVISLLDESKNSKKTEKEIIEVSPEKPEIKKGIDCAICMENFTDPKDIVTFKCKHSFDLNCVVQIENSLCPLCRAKIRRVPKYIRSILRKNNMNRRRIKELREEIANLRRYGGQGQIRMIPISNPRGNNNDEDGGNLNTQAFLLELMRDILGNQTTQSQQD